MSSPYPVAVYSIGLERAGIKIQFLLPSEGLRGFRFNWRPDRRYLVEGAFNSCWERAAELMAGSLGAGYSPYLVNGIAVLRWLESAGPGDEAFFLGWKNAPLRPGTRSAKGEWWVRGGPFRVLLYRLPLFGPARKGKRLLVARFQYGSELIGALEASFPPDRGPEFMARLVRSRERERAEESASRLRLLIEGTARTSPGIHFAEDWSRELYALQSHFLNAGLRKAEFDLEGESGGEADPPGGLPLQPGGRGG